ncbi:hypothetical protein CTO_1017 [Chlamydia trachomatis A2497]|uniref:Uncharacterized protein n=1 Tax=Chlamydia trachomatis serovar A (strain A2497) TaxID=580047 RepID=G4NLX3_CHLT4|nr:hypothetical protein CTO_1017 [Chlamydia trachomatis A2497]
MVRALISTQIFFLKASLIKKKGTRLSPHTRLAS